MNTTRYRELLSRYIRNECSPAEIDELFEFIAHHSGSDILEDAADREIGNIDLENYRIPEEKSKALKAALASKMATRHLKTPQQRRWSPLFKAAAAVALVMVCTWLVYRLSGTTAPERITHVTAYGELKKITLPDNSVVTLNSNSRLSYDKDWSSASVRKVALEGEAFFKVTHQLNNQRFLVFTRNEVEVEVLGTEFTVNDRHLNTKVVLHSGKVKLDIDNREGDNTIMMRSGELVEVARKADRPDGARQITKKLVNTNMYIAWKNDKLVFQDTELSDILLMLEDNYGFSVTVHDETVLKERFNGTFPSRDADVLLKTLAKVYPVVIDGKKVMVGI